MVEESGSVRIIGSLVEGILDNNLVRFFVNANGVWNVEQLSSELPLDIVQKILIMKPPCSHNNYYYLEWTHSSDGKFSTRETYIGLSKSSNLIHSQLNKNILEMARAGAHKISSVEDCSRESSNK